MCDQPAGGGGGGATGKEQRGGNNTINTRCCVGVGQAIYTEVVSWVSSSLHCLSTRQYLEHVLCSLSASSRQLHLAPISVSIALSAALDSYTSHSNFRE